MFKGTTEEKNNINYKKKKMANSILSSYQKYLHLKKLPHTPNRKISQDLPFSCFLRLRLLHILTAHIDKIIATMKNRIPPTTPAVIALCYKNKKRRLLPSLVWIYVELEFTFTRAGTGNLTSSLDS